MLCSTHSILTISSFFYSIPLLRPLLLLPTLYISLLHPSPTYIYPPPLLLPPSSPLLQHPSPLIHPPPPYPFPHIHDMNKIPTSTLTTTFHKHLWEENPYVQFGYGPQKISNTPEEKFQYQQTLIQLMPMYIPLTPFYFRTYQ